MPNPFESPKSRSSAPRHDAASNRYQFAGWWLIATGLFHLIAIHLLSGTDSLSTLITEPALLILLGVLVLYRIQIAVIISRLIGSLFGLGLVALTIALPIILVSGAGTSGAISYGRYSIENPSLWQAGILLFVVAATFMPPWWSLQMAIRDQNT